MITFFSKLFAFALNVLFSIILQSQQEMDFVVLFMGLFYVCIAFAEVLIICELAQRGCDLFNNIDEIFVQMNWYLLPNKTQRLLPVIINMIQQITEIKCFGSISCNRDTFKKVSALFNNFNCKAL